MNITTDLIVGCGLVVALVLSIVLGGATELQTTLASGLIGYLGRVGMEHITRGADKNERDNCK